MKKKREMAIGHFHFTLPRKLHEEVRLAAKATHRSMLQFVKDCTLRGVEEWREAGGKKGKRGKEKIPASALVPRLDEPLGLGIRARKRAREAMAAEHATTPPVPTPREAEPKRDPADEIERFVEYVLDAESAADRENRIDRVVEIVSKTARSRADAKAITAQLDKRLAEREAERDPEFGKPIEADVIAGDDVAG